MRLDIALKEWAGVVELMLAGRACLLLRKGGVHEEAGPGRFHLEHDRFALWPAWEHERLDWIKPGWHTPAAEKRAEKRCQEPFSEPDPVPVASWAEVVKIWQVPSRAAFDRLDDLHPWAKPQIDMRFNYKPDRPLYLLALRPWRLPAPAMIPNQPRYAGCRSWIDLDPSDAIHTGGSEPAICDADVSAIITRVDQAFD